MKQVVLDTATARSLQEIYALVELGGPQPGDSLKVVQRPVLDEQAKEAFFLLALIAVHWYMSRSQKSELLATELLDDLFKKYNSAEELEKDLQAEFNVTITRETTPGTPEGWSQLSMGTFEQAAFGDDIDPEECLNAIRAEMVTCSKRDTTGRQGTFIR